MTALVAGIVADMVDEFEQKCLALVERISRCPTSKAGRGAILTEVERVRRADIPEADERAWVAYIEAQYWAARAAG